MILDFAWSATQFRIKQACCLEVLNTILVRKITIDQLPGNGKYSDTSCYHSVIRTDYSVSIREVMNLIRT